MPAFDAGYSKTPLHKKLGCKPDRTVYLLGPPDGFAAYLASEGFTAQTLADVTEVPDGAAHVHLFSTSVDEVTRVMAHMSRTMARDGQVWISWPKKASGVPHDIPKDVLHRKDAFGDLVDVKVCAVDETWSGLKYVIRKDRR